MILRLSYEKSASLYALSHKSFEEIALKFLQINEDEALKQFLIYKLDTLTERDITQSTILLLWLLEILLNQMGSLKNAGKESTEKYHIIEAEFKSLLSQNKIKVILLWQVFQIILKFELIFQNCLIQSRKAIYDLISSHGNETNLIYFAVLMQDYDRVIEYYLQHKNYREALNVLKQQVISYKLFKKIIKFMNRLFCICCVFKYLNIWNRDCRICSIVSLQLLSKKCRPN